MKIAIICDSFKESLSSLDVARAVECGFRRVFPKAQYYSFPIADGGEGTIQALVEATKGRLVSQSTRGALGQNITASFGVTGDEKTAIIDMAETAGLATLPPDKRNPLLTTTYGVGMLVRAALDHGYRHIILGLGGSATNDGGIGFAQALGVRFYRNDGQELPISGGGALRDIARIDCSALDKRLSETQLECACDVTNPLLGEMGASAVFGPQKGASASDIGVLETGLRHYAALIERETGRRVSEQPGAGAAGGLGAALMAFTSARFRPGVMLIAERMNLPQKMASMDLIITGEGALDRQTAQGKVPVGIARLAKAYGKPVIALAGAVKEGSDAVYAEGIDAFFPAVQRPCSLKRALEEAHENVSRSAENIARTVQVGIKMAADDTVRCH